MNALHKGAVTVVVTAALAAALFLSMPPRIDGLPASPALPADLDAYVFALTIVDGYIQFDPGIMFVRRLSGIDQKIQQNLL